MMISLIRFLTKLNIIPLITNLSSLIIMIFINVFIIKFVAIFENKIMEYFQLIKKKCYKTFYQANKLYPLFKKMKKDLKRIIIETQSRKASYILVVEYGQYQDYIFQVFQLLQKVLLFKQILLVEKQENLELNM